MRIAYFNANLQMGQDGVTRCVYKMIDGALQRGHDVIAVTSTLPDGEPPVPIYRVPSLALPLQKKYRLAIPGYQAFAKILDDFRPDILHVNSPCTLGFGALRYAKQYRIPIVATYHTHFPTYPRYYNLSPFEKLTWTITRRFYNGMDRTFVPTVPILEELREHDVQHLEYLPNGVDTTGFSPEHRSEKWRERFGSEKSIILFVSRLVWEKDLKILAECYRHLRTRRDDFEMVIVGDGHARAELERMMPGAHFLGYQSGKTLAESFSSADIFVFPSTTETFGLVTLEAMASGLAPVAAKVGGAVGIIQEGSSGYFAKPLNAVDMADKVERLLDNPEERKAIGGQAVLHAQQFRWDRVLDQLFSSYRDVVADAAPQVTVKVPAGPPRKEFRIVHISDPHLSRLYYREHIKSFKTLLRSILEEGFDHLVLTGDIVSTADPDDYFLAREILSGFGLLHPELLTVVPGNHDVFGGPHRATDVLSFPDHIRTVDYHRGLALFQEAFAECFNGIEQLSEKQLYPFIKRVGPIDILALNSVPPWSLRYNILASNGSLDEEQWTSLTKLAETVTDPSRQRVVAIHHHFSDLQDATTTNSIWRRIESRTMRMRKRRKLIRLFGALSVNAVLHGHIHRNEIYEQNAIHFANGGGAVCDDPVQSLKYNVVNVDERSLAIATRTLPIPYASAVISKSFNTFRNARAVPELVKA